MHTSGTDRSRGLREGKIKAQKDNFQMWNDIQTFQIPISRAGGLLTPFRVLADYKSTPASTRGVVFTGFQVNHWHTSPHGDFFGSILVLPEYDAICG